MQSQGKCTRPIRAGNLISRFATLRHEDIHSGGATRSAFYKNSNEQTPSARTTQLAGIVTTGAFDVSVTSASAIRFCTTVNAYFESKSLLSIQ